MDKEVAPVVLTAIENRRLSGPKLNPTELVEKMGVRDARSQPYEYAWVATGGGIIATIWAEFIHVHSSGRWFYVESLDTQHRLGGGERSEDQKQRAERRLGLLKRAYDAHQSFRAVLQTNRVPIAELERNKSARVSVRVRDDDEWHVADWSAAGGYAVLLRGPRGWVPTAAEATAALKTGRTHGVVTVVAESSASPLPPSPPSPSSTSSSPPSSAAASSSLSSPSQTPTPSPPPSPAAADAPTKPSASAARGGQTNAAIEPVSQAQSQPRWVFPDQATRDRVEAAAMAHMTAHFEGKGLGVQDVSSQNLGYDLEVSAEPGKGLFKVEVKGTSAALPGFFLTRNERACSARESIWRLAVVTDALGPQARHTLYTAQDMERLFAFDALAWRCDLQP